MDLSIDFISSSLLIKIVALAASATVVGGMVEETGSATALICVGIKVRVSISAIRHSIDFFMSSNILRDDVSASCRTSVKKYVKLK